MSVDRERLKEDVIRIKDYLAYREKEEVMTSYCHSLRRMLSLSEQYLEGKIVEVACSKCQDRGVVHMDNPEKSYICDCKSGENWTSEGPTLVDCLIHASKITELAGYDLSDSHWSHALDNNPFYHELAKEMFFFINRYDGKVPKDVGAGKGERSSHE